MLDVHLFTTLALRTSSALIHASTLLRQLEHLDRASRLASVISTEGLSRGLLAYADPSGVLPSRVPSLPTYHSLDRTALNAVDPRNRAAVIGLEAYTVGSSEMVMAGINHLNRETVDALGIFDQQADLWEKSLITMKNMVGVLVDSDNIASSHVTARDAGVMHRIIIDTTTAVAELPRADFTSLSKDAAELIRSALIGVSGHLQGPTGLRFDGSTAAIIPAAIDPAMIATEGKLGDKGWSPGVFAVLCDSAHVLIDSLESLSHYYHKHPPESTTFGQSGEGINPDPEIVKDPDSVPATESAEEGDTDTAVLAASICICINVVLQVCTAVVAELTAVGTAIQDAGRLDGAIPQEDPMAINYFTNEEPDLTTNTGTGTDDTTTGGAGDDTATSGADAGDTTTDGGDDDAIAAEVASEDAFDDDEGDDDGSDGVGDGVTDTDLRADDGDV